MLRIANPSRRKARVSRTDMSRDVALPAQKAMTCRATPSARTRRRATSPRPRRGKALCTRPAGRMPLMATSNNPAPAAARIPSPTTPNRGRVVKPLTDSTNMTWTRSRLESERNDWWDTQVTGSQEVWGAIRLAAQSLQLGKMREAQQWLEAMECTCPTGSLWKGVYDKTGIMYKIPEWLIVEPDGLVPENAGDGEAGESAGAAGQDGAQEEDDEEDDEPVVVRARISRNGRDVMLKLQKKQTVASIVEKIREQVEVRLYHVQGEEYATIYFSHIEAIVTISNGFSTAKTFTNDR
jgi:hypothetical protein